jgi:hypothetical protein
MNTNRKAELVEELYELRSERVAVKLEYPTAPRTERKYLEGIIQQLTVDIERVQTEIEQLLKTSSR